MSRESDHYEAVTRQILHNLREHLGLDSIRGKAKYAGHRSGTKWEIDGTCYRAATGTFVLIECRKYTEDRVKQGEVGDLAYRIADVGADEGLIVTPIGFQEGARLVARAERIGLVRLNAEATESDYVLEIAGQLFSGFSLYENVAGKDSVLVSVFIPVADTGRGHELISVEKYDSDPSRTRQTCLRP